METNENPVESRTSMPLPLLILYTQNGSIPFLSWNFIHQFNNEILFHSKNDDEEINFVKLNVGDFFDYLDESGGDHRLSSMKYFKNCSFILSLFDPLRNSKDFYKSNDQKIAIETYQGKKMLSVDDMLKLSRTIGVDHVQSLADIITPPIAGRKWTNKSVDRSNKFLDEIISQQQQKEDSGNKIKLWATVTGGFQHESRYRSCQKISQYSDCLQAIIIDGFFGYKTDGQDNDDDLEENLDNFQQILTGDIIPNLPEQIPKVLFGCFYPDTIIRLIRSGIQIFDSSICTLLTNRGRALPSPLISNVEPKLLFERSTEMINDDDPNPSIILDLNNISFKNSDRLISNKCKCYTCNKGFTRSYINHLLKRNEINSRILLQIHNHYVLTEFFSRIRLIIIDGYFDQLLVNSNVLDDKFSQPQPPPSSTTTTMTSLPNGK
uniref:Queuine tRNA-ribosyltransferase accessory subunit 2-like n=1 Tax=Dermatophagoides pteronyssinus TaxID=6956 RepID=A0A6P6YK75_DERPT|nr:queuine tRNA-ribosyltransferase accessory subunit 2-like [Dermatophagoides pteronyssinus]